MTEPTELLPCPFCGAGESQIHVNKGTWNGRGYGEPVSVEVRHWCADVPDQPSRMISRAGRDEASAIAAWNTLPATRAVNVTVSGAPGLRLPAAPVPQPVPVVIQVTIRQAPVYHYTPPHQHFYRNRVR